MFVFSSQSDQALLALGRQFGGGRRDWLQADAGGFPAEKLVLGKAVQAYLPVLTGRRQTTGGRSQTTDFPGVLAQQARPLGRPPTHLFGAVGAEQPFLIDPKSPGRSLRSPNLIGPAFPPVPA